MMTTQSITFGGDSRHCYYGGFGPKPALAPHSGNGTPDLPFANHNLFVFSILPKQSNQSDVFKVQRFHMESLKIIFSMLSKWWLHNSTHLAAVAAITTMGVSGPNPPLVPIVAMAPWTYILQITICLCFDFWLDDSISRTFLRSNISHGNSQNFFCNVEQMVTPQFNTFGSCRCHYYYGGFGPKPALGPHSGNGTPGLPFANHNLFVFSFLATWFDWLYNFEVQ